MSGGTNRRVRLARELPSPRTRAADDPTGSAGEVVVVDRRDVITGSDDGRPGRDERVFRASPSSSRAIRSFVCDALRGARARSDVIADLQLVVSELAANAIEHGVGEQVTVEVDWTDARWWQVTVSSTIDAGRLGAVRDWTMADVGAGSGRGLGIVRRLVDDVWVDRRGDHVAVRCRVRR